MTRTKLFLLAATCVATLSSCGDSDSVTSPVEGPKTSFGAAVLGTWTADTTLTLSAGGIPVTPSLVVINTLRPDSSFSGELRLENILDNDVDSAIYTRAGQWSVLGDSALVLTSTTCRQADTLRNVALGLALPFTFPGLKRNPMVTVPCGAPDTVRTKPVGNTWTVPLVVNMPGLATGTWSLSFSR
jgi:hypothetical protein